MTKPALAMIVKASDDEAVLLRRCLESAKDHVSGIYLTITGENAACEQVAKDFGAVVSHFTWTGDFAAARTYNFSQVPVSEAYILWLDCDDKIVGGENLGEVCTTMETRGVKGAYVQYKYDFDEHGNCSVRHIKIRLIRNDDSFSWGTSMGELHEDLIPKYKCLTAALTAAEPSCYFEVHHLTTDERVKENAKRNLAIARKQAKTYPEDPRALWNLANSLSAVGEQEEALKIYAQFLKETGSEAEAYLAHHRMAFIHAGLGHAEEAKDAELRAINIFPWYPDAWIGLGTIYYGLGKWKHAKEFLIQGMSKELDDSMIVMNPRDYDEHPMKLLANCYFNTHDVRSAQTVLRKLDETFPGRKDTKDLLRAINKVVADEDIADEFVAKAKTMSDVDLSIALEGLEPKLRSHPRVCIVRNERFRRNSAPPKEIVYYCGYTEEEWGRESELKGIGGSEEAVLNLSKRWAKEGFEVHIYNHCGDREKVDEHGVTWHPYWTFNPRDVFDTVILWRFPVMSEARLDARCVLLDLHDVLPEAELTATRVGNLDKILVKSSYHRGLFPQVSEDKFEVIGNGFNPEDFAGSEKRQSHTLIYTSSPDRGLEHLLDAWPEIRKNVPDAELKVYYGWGVFDAVYKGDQKMMAWKESMLEKLKQPGIKVKGRVGHHEIARRMMQTDVYAYPCHFEEIFCISAVKAQAAGCRVVTTNYAALTEVVRTGDKVKGDVKGERIWKPWVKAVLWALKIGTAPEIRLIAKEGVMDLEWNNIAKTWTKHFGQ